MTEDSQTLARDREPASPDVSTSHGGVSTTFQSCQSRTVCAVSPAARPSSGECRVRILQCRYNTNGTSDFAVTANITYSVVPVIPRYSGTRLAIGSGFLYCKDDHIYLVTAWHNLSGRNSITLDPLNSKCGIPNEIAIDFPHAVNNGATTDYFRNSIIIPIDQNGQCEYWVHSQKWPRVDVAVIPLNPFAKYQTETRGPEGEIGYGEQTLIFGSQFIIPCVRHNPRPGTEAHSVGDDLFIIGYPEGVTDYLSNPIWKRGTIAVEYEQGWNGSNRFLINSATRKGLSGGLTIYYDKKGSLPGSYGITYAGEPLYIIHGVYVGRVDDDDLFSAQLGIVWKQVVIDEIIDLKLVGISSHEIVLPVVCQQNC